VQGLLGPLGQLVDPSDVRGTVHVRLAVERQNAAVLEVLIGDSIACRRSFASSSSGFSLDLGLTAAVEIQCPVNTAEFDSTTAVPRFRNGPAQLSARLLTADGTVVHRDPGFQVRLSNPNTVVARIVEAPQATDAAGLRWITGPLTLVATPVNYDPDVPLRQVTFVYGFPGGVTQTVRDTAAPFRTVFPDSFPDRGALRGLVDPEFQIRLSTATDAGGTGPIAYTAPERYDAAAPVPGALMERAWVGAATMFSELYDARDQSDRGVGRVSVRFYAGDPILSDTALVSRGKEVTRGSDLPARASPGYRLAALVCDALENCAPTGSIRFGVDVVAPTVENVSFGDRVINPSRPLALTLQDDLSGFDPRPLEARVQLLDADAGTAECGPQVEGSDLPGRLAGGTCVPDTVASLIPVPDATPGYYTYTVTPLDRALNRGTTVTRRVLVDQVRPRLASVSLPAQFVPGDEATVSAQATDNLDLTEVTVRLVYPAVDNVGSLAIPFGAASAVGAAFDATLTSSAAASVRLPFIRTLSSIGTAGRFTVLVDSVQVQALDAAGLSDVVNRAVAPSTYGGNSSTADPFPAVSSLRLLPDVTGMICTLECQPGDRTAVTLELRVLGASSLGPFNRVYFFRRDLNGTVTLIGSVADVVITSTAAGTSLTYALPYTPPAGLTGKHSFFAVGVSSRGDGIRTAPEPISFFRR
jgi:hypothetical protein